MAHHVDHEMSRLLWIGEMLRRWDWMLPDTVLRALRVAYAGHARAVLEFFHDGRLNDSRQRKRRGRRSDNDIDVQLYDYTGQPPGAHLWNAEDEQRLLDADKLLAHLSTGRLALDRQQLPEWGDDEDRARFHAIIEQIMAEATDAHDMFRDTTRALREAGA